MTRPHSSGSDDFDPARREHWPDPPEPTEQQWDAMYDRLAARLPRRVGIGRRWVAATTGVGLIAAAVLAAWGVWVAFTPPAPALNASVETTTPPDPLAGYDVLPVATADDVMVSAVRGSDIRFGSIRHPVPDTLPLATVADVTVLRGPATGEMCCPEPGGMAVYVMPEK